MATAAFAPGNRPSRDLAHRSHPALQRADPGILFPEGLELVLEIERSEFPDPKAVEVGDEFDGFLQVAREEEFGGARWEHVSFHVPERYAIRDKEGNDYFDAGEDGVSDPELTIARKGKDQFKTLQIYLDFHLL